MLPYTGSEKSPVKLEASFTNEGVDPHDSYDMELTKKNKSSSPHPHRRSSLSDEVNSPRSW